MCCLQVAFADTILLNKTDLITTERLQEASPLSLFPNNGRLVSSCHKIAAMDLTDGTSVTGSGCGAAAQPGRPTVAVREVQRGA